MPATKREQLEKLVHDMQTLADACDAKGAYGADDQEAMHRYMAEATLIKQALTTESEAAGTLADTKAFLAALGAAPGDEPKNGKTDHAGLNHDLTVSGLPMDPKGQTLGELFVQSEAFEALNRYKNLEGIIPPTTKGVATPPWQVGMDLKDLVTGVSSTSGGAMVVNDRYGPVTDLIGERRLTVADLVTRSRTTSDTIEYVRVTGKTNNASPVVEASATTGTSGTKPESALTLEVVSTTVKTIAHWIPITKRAASDAPQVRTLVDNFLRYGLQEELEDQILTGAGTGENLTGITSTSGINTTGSAGTDIDAIVDAIRLIQEDRRFPNAMVIHPNDWYSTNFLLAKDTTNQYLIANPRAGVDQLNQLWGLRVVVTPAMTENTALVGEFRFGVLWEREGITLSLFDQHSDFAIRNMLVVLAEMRAAFGVLDPEAFCTVTAI